MTTDSSETNAVQVSELELGRNVAWTIHSAFLVPVSENEVPGCNTIAQDTLEEAEKRQSFYGILNYECSGYYMYEYNGFAALLVGIGTLIIVFLFSFDIAVRMIKLGILRLLSPIPAISYIDPKSSRDGMFANYIKTLTSTYLDLFLRLAIIYLVIFIIANIAQNDQTLFSNMGSPTFAKVIIYISLLFFAGQAPKFIQQSLGIKSKGTGLGFGAALVGGALSGMLSGARTGGWTGALGGLAKGVGASNRNFWNTSNGGQSQGSAWRVGGTEGVRFGTNNNQARYEGFIARGMSRIHGLARQAYSGTTDDEIAQQQEHGYALQEAVNIVRDARAREAQARANGEEYKFTYTAPDGTHFEFDSTVAEKDLAAHNSRIDAAIRKVETAHAKQQAALDQWSKTNKAYQVYDPSVEVTGGTPVTRKQTKYAAKKERSLQSFLLGISADASAWHCTSQTGCHSPNPATSP